MLKNVYEGPEYAAAYSNLEWGGTYHLIARDLPGILRKHTMGTRALDFGCGAGRSTRFLRALGFSCVGIDISEAMVAKARELDPDTPYHVVSGSDFTAIGSKKFNVVLACFPFDNIEGDEFKVELMQALHQQLAPGGILINIVSAEELYHNEWVSFTTERFPENKIAKPGDVVRTVTRTFAGSPVCDDILCDDETYRRLYQMAGFNEIACYRPLGRDDDGIDWKSEAEIAPWVIWVVSPS